MKDRKSSETFDAIYESDSKKTNELLNSCTNLKGTQLWEISQTLKLATNRLKATKTIITKNKIVYSNIATQSMMKEVIQKGT
jgi:hypothetical protein